MTEKGTSLFGVDMSRRSFTALAAAAGAAVALGGGASKQALAVDAEATPAAEEETIKRVRTMCRGCGKMECCVWVTVENGRATKIEGDEGNFGSYGNCCTKSQASLQACYHPDRLRYPLKRTNPKGDADPGWVRISWDEALQTMADKYGEIVDTYGENSIMTMCGTSRQYAGVGCRILGSSVFKTANHWHVYQICKGPRHWATMFQSNRAFSWMATVDRPRVFVQWGGASEISNYDDSCRTTVDVATKADFHISVDPRMTNMGKEADLWLPLRPGTDGAMALGWLNVIINNNLYNEMWVKRWTDLPFLVVEDMEATEMTNFVTASTKPIRTKLLKESDLIEGGSANRFMVWDAIGDRLTYFDTDTGYWENEAPLNITSGRQLPGHEVYQENMVPGVTPGYVPDLSDFSRCDPIIDPAIEGTYSITLKDGRDLTARPAWEYFVEHVNRYDPDTVADICGVPAEDIVKAATIYATPIDPSTGYGNGGIQYMLAIEHSCNAVQTARALDAIVGLTNNFDTPGGHRGPTISVMNHGNYTGAADLSLIQQPLEATLNAAGVNDIPTVPELTLVFNNAQGDATAIWDCCQRAERAQYPIYAGFCDSGDVMAMSNSLYGWESLLQLDFLVTIDLWHTPTAQVSDLLLPCRHWMEIDCPRSSQGSSGIEGGLFHSVEPLGESMFDLDIACQLLKKFGIPWHAAGATDEEKWPEAIVDLNINADKYLPLTKDYPGEGSWEKYRNFYQEQGPQDAKALQPETWGTYRRFETGVALSPQSLDPSVPATFGKPGLHTPTLKQEIWNTHLETYHPVEQPFFGQDIENFSRPDELSGDTFDKIGPFTLPTYTEPPEGPRAQPERAKEYPFIMTTGRRIPVYFHSEHRQLPWCRELWPAPRVEINPADAQALGIEQGDWVWIETERGKIREVADLYYGIAPGVINCEHTWWMPEFKAANRGYDQVNVNTLLNKDLRDPISGSTNLRAYNVKIYKATPENSPNNNPVPTDIDGQEMIHSASDPRLKEWLPVYDREGSDGNYAERNGVQL